MEDLHPFKKKLEDRIENDFTYHPPFGNQVQRYFLIRQACKELALLLVKNCPESRELSIALTHIEESCMYANAAIARNELDKQP